MVDPADTIAKLYATSDKLDVWSRMPPKLSECERRLTSSYCTGKDIRILTVGCGAGRETIAIYEAGFRNVVGLDCTPELLAVARQRAAGMCLPIDFHLARATEMPFSSASFAVVTLFTNVYGHITPRAARLDALREAGRCLKSGGLILLEATSILNRFRYFVAIRILEIARMFHNPRRMERGDKLIRNAGKVAGVSAEAMPRSHWFRPGEIDADADEVGLEVVLASTTKGVLQDPLRHSRQLHKAGWLEYVLRKNK